MATAKPRGRPFAPGNRANPSGRPRGARNRETVKLEALMRKDAPAVVAAMLTMAQTGSVAAGKLILDRLVVPPRDRPVQIDLGPTRTLEDLDAAHDVLLGATCDGSITPSEAAALAGLLDAKRRALEGGDLERRIAELESKGKAT
jgi:hypothetical protein